MHIQNTIIFQNFYTLKIATLLQPLATATRLWFTRDTIQKGQFDLIHMPRKEIPADKLTKLGNVSEHAQSRSQILGLSLLPSDTKI